jgi:hypothetical protein
VNAYRRAPPKSPAITLAQLISKRRKDLADYISQARDVAHGIMAKAELKAFAWRLGDLAVPLSRNSVSAEDDTSRVFLPALCIIDGQPRKADVSKQADRRVLPFRYY